MSGKENNLAGMTQLQYASTHSSSFRFEGRLPILEDRQAHAILDHIVSHLLHRHNPWGYRYVRWGGNNLVGPWSLQIPRWRSRERGNRGPRGDVRFNTGVMSLRIGTYHADVENGLQRHLLQRSYVDGLRVISKPDNQGQ